MLYLLDITPQVISGWEEGLAGMCWLLCPDSRCWDGVMREDEADTRGAQVTWPGIVTCDVLWLGRGRAGPHIVMSRISSIHQTAHCSRHTVFACLASFYIIRGLRVPARILLCPRVPPRQIYAFLGPALARHQASPGRAKQQNTSVYGKYTREPFGIVNLPWGNWGKFANFVSISNFCNCWGNIKYPIVRLLLLPVYIFSLSRAKLSNTENEV